MRNLEEFNGRFVGETCFVIGAGPSVLDHDLTILRGRVTIAVNSGYVAAPWATFFLSDDWSCANWSYVFNDLRHSETTALLYEAKLANCAVWFGGRSVLFRHQKGICIPDKYMHADPRFHLGETRSSLGSAMMAAKIMGCSKIVLIGADCCRKNGFRYFWQMPEFTGKRPCRNDGVPLDRYQKCKVGGEVTDYDLIDIHRTWSDFAPAVNEKCAVYNASVISKLKFFPYIALDDC